MSIFEFDDNAHVGRLHGTLHAPGSTPGFVPTAQADGSLLMAAGGAQPAAPITLAFTLADITPLIVGGVAFLPVPAMALNDGDVVVGAGVAITQVWDDTGGPTFTIAAAIGDPYSVTTVPLAGNADGTSLPTPDAGIVNLTDFVAYGNSAPTTLGLVMQGQGPVPLYVSAGLFNGDGATGAGVARLVVVRA